MSDKLRLLNGNIIHEQQRRIVNFDVRDKTLYVIVQGDINSPTEIFSVNSGECFQLSDHANDSGLAASTFGHCLFIYCPTLDGKEIIESIYLTPAQFANLDRRSAKPLPTLVLLHGGPYGRIADAFDVWNSAYGHRFANYLRGGMGVFNELDVIAATQHAIASGLADPSRLVAGGWRQGGYLAYRRLDEKDDQLCQNTPFLGLLGACEIKAVHYTSN
ncbi:hypothetical protein PT974_03082 [Cladobotryum mycophilum]|uniref:Peptidase S9 prolyl oligopeptidase catalytic domain-containing protein n=1 Tax=Cladobotryum mycophilum TaxID=491253 RepID=A0ABR0SVY4_9HYPO